MRGTPSRPGHRKQGQQNCERRCERLPNEWGKAEAGLPLDRTPASLLPPWSPDSFQRPISFIEANGARMILGGSRIADHVLVGIEGIERQGRVLRHHGLGSRYEHLWVIWYTTVVIDGLHG